jgi:hypothetical protein
MEVAPNDKIPNGLSPSQRVNGFTERMENIPVAINLTAVQRLLGIQRSVPLTHAEMLAGLRVSFFPAKELSPRPAKFLSKLRCGFEKLGIEVIEFAEALANGRNGKVDRGVILIAAGEFTEGQLPTDFVPSLSENIIVGVYDRPSPIKKHVSQQERIDAVIGDMGWDIVQVIVYLEDETWTVCNMNGAIIPLPNRDDISLDILECLLSKLAAPVVPPRISDFEVRFGAFDAFGKACSKGVRDMLDSGPLWEESGLFVYQTAVARIQFRNAFYRRLGTAFVDRRTGMSYGFLVRQLPQTIEPAISEREAIDRFGELKWKAGCIHEIDETWYVCLNAGGQRWVVPVPDVWVLCTRSGCTKTRLDARRDILRMGLSKGRFILEFPKDLESGADCKPSYDSGVILAHALGNSFVASLLARLKCDSDFLRMMQTDGLGIAHWHGYLPASKIPTGYAVYGADNIPFACSTPQSAILALQGKLLAFQEQFDSSGDYRGDVHVEPHHGTNMTATSLVDLARWLLPQ